MAAETFFINVLRMISIYLKIVVGAVGTFTIGILRIVFICTIESKIGSETAQLFHNYREELYFVDWIIIHLIILLLLSVKLGDTSRNWMKTAPKMYP